ncbi:PREDICTED: SH3 and cysteine-rich domain-containing protein isoform X2 [Colobus angolensis palliatus]|nr:PREDICTED: SH3 and cysteine-rich domain-containing protein isoform X2 [Colobus angolensis palliatus]
MRELLQAVLSGYIIHRFSILWGLGLNFQHPLYRITPTLCRRAPSLPPALSRALPPACPHYSRRWPRSPAPELPPRLLPPPVGELKPARPLPSGSHDCEVAGEVAAGAAGRGGAGRTLLHAGGSAGEVGRAGRERGRGWRRARRRLGQDGSPRDPELSSLARGGQGAQEDSSLAVPPGAQHRSRAATMIPPSLPREDDVDGLSKEAAGAEQPPSPASTSSQESKLQKLKRSLSFKTKSLRSKSADNFFQRTNSEDTKLQAHMVAEISPSSSPLPAPGSLTSTPARAGLHPGSKAHAFQDYIFKKPTFCDVCNHMIVACGNKVDPVYETLRFGTSLAQRTKKGSSGSGSDSPHRTSTSDLVEVPEEVNGPGGGYDLRKRSNSVFTYPENGTDDFRDPAKDISHQGSLSKDPLQMHTYVALYKFVPQENEDLEMRPGDIITLLEDSNEDWWKGKIQDRIGFFPANFVQRLQQNEKIFRCVRTFIGCKEQGQITLKENQICVSSEEEQDGFIRVLSGKKKGLIPLDVLENI